MIQTGFETRVKIQEIVENQLPEFILSESPKTSEFLKQYYISQEIQGGTVDIVENLDQYLKLDNLTAEVIQGETYLISDIDISDSTIFVESTKGYPKKYGLLKIDDEIITYTGITTNSFTNCIRGFSGITTYSDQGSPQNLVFSTSEQSSHIKDSKVQNLSVLFLKEFYKKIKYSLTPELENYDFVENLNVSTFIKEAKSFYQSKGTKESFRILFQILYGVNPKVVNLDSLLLKASSAEFLKREVLLAEFISGENPFAIVGQTIRKSTDLNTQASVSSVEIVTRNNKSYYKFSLFVGYGDNAAIDGIFTVPGKTKVIEDVFPGQKVITVDSTIGFPEVGSLICNNNIITYQEKTINQFLDCKEHSNDSIVTKISSTDDIRFDEVIFGYENGDLNKKCEFRMVGVINKFTQRNKIYSSVEGEKIYVKNLGEKIINPQNKTLKQIFANSWIYNTSSTYQIKSINGATFVLFSDIDKSSLRVNDTVEILIRNTNQVIFTGAKVSNINQATREINLDNLVGFVYNPLLKYDLRRKIKKSSSSSVPITYGNDAIFSDVQNLYNENDKYFYVASNSLPSYNIDNQKSEIALQDASGTAIQGFNTETLKYSIISFNNDVPFITGDEIYYKPNNISITGLEEGRYYVEVLENRNQIRLYVSRVFIFLNNYVEFSPLPSGSGSHLFSIYNQANKIISPKKLLKKIPINPNITDGKRETTKVGSTGILVNGVEILNYKSSDKIYYGPLESLDLISTGNDYDVVNPPVIEISPSLGTTALAQPILKGSLIEIVVDPQNFDINRVISLSITGGNNTGAVLEPVLEKQFREVLFDGRLSTLGGGVDVDNETITFVTNHNFLNGEALIYDHNQNEPIGIGSFNSNNKDEKKYLEFGNVYFPKIINNRTIQLFKSFSDFATETNPIGFTTINTQGIHKFRLANGKTTLKTINVLNPGSEFQNRKLLVKPNAIDVTNSIITFNNHGFSDGDLIDYNFENTPISGLTTSVQYNVLKLNENTFRLCDAGVGGTNRTNFINKQYTNLYSQGSGYHIFKYPDIKINLNVEYIDEVGIITATPIIKGQIIDTYLYENGTDYGSDILNLHKKPKVVIKQGKNAQLKAIISNGKIIGCEIQNGGQNYTSSPDLIIDGDGVGGKLRAIISNGSISTVIIINSGVNYTALKTQIKVVPRGKGALFNPRVRSLTVNNLSKYGKNTLISSNVDENLEYVWIGYSTSISKEIFNDDGVQHSPIIGWSYDGNPIYGPYGYSSPNDISSPITIIHSGYELDTSTIVNRPSNFTSGFFIEDYSFKNSGDLDVNNGRFCKTPEFPNGIYAYFATVRSGGSSVDNLVPDFPYFIGDSYRSNSLLENSFINQNFDFNSSNLIRNTFPYKVSDLFATNNFLSETDQIGGQFSIVESVTKGSVSSIVIEQPGSGYKVNDLAVFNNDGTNGGGINAYVNQITGRPIKKIETNLETYDNCIITKTLQNEILISTGSTHSIRNKDSVIISNLSTDIFNLNTSHEVQVDTYSTYVYKDIPPNAVSGIVTDIYVSNVPSDFSVNSKIGVGTEFMTILNIFGNENIIRVKRGLSGLGHSTSDLITSLPDSFKIRTKTPNFNSKLNDKIFFNAHEVIGIGTTSGVVNAVTYYIGNTSKIASIPSQSIYLPNHPFKNNQLVTLRKTSGSSPIQVRTTPSSSSFYLMSVGNEEQVYIINKSKDYIGLTTNVGLTTNTSGLYFVDNGSNNYEYSIESNYDQLTGKIQKVKSTVFLDENHDLQNGDEITLNAISNQNVGIGTTISLKIYYNSLYNKLLINQIGFSSSGINTESNVITIPNHKFKTGNKVFYYSDSENASGILTGGYYVYEIGKDSFKLTNSYNDVFSPSPSFVNIVSVGGTFHTIGLINPEIKVYKNNNLIFNLSDSSLVGYKLKIFYDNKFENEFVSTGNTSTFSIETTGIPGFENSTLKINYSNNLPTKLFYNLEKSGFISTSDKDVNSGSQITYVNSLYNGTYKISGIGLSTFDINLRNVPEEMMYSKNGVLSFNYSTNSLNEQGGVYSVAIPFGGSNYKKLPVFEKFISTSGKNAFIRPLSEKIGQLDSVRILDPGYEYASDRTLRPEAYISPLIFLQNCREISSVEIIDGGKNYSSPPDLVLVHPINREVATDGLIELKLSSNSISGVEIVQSPRGLDAVEYEIYTTNNSNGLSIQSIESAEASGIVTCYLTTPVLGFTSPQFTSGDQVFVEGIQRDTDNYGNGFNSSDYGYRFFEVISYLNTNPAKIEYKLPNGIVNPGFAKTIQNSYASIVNKNNYPSLSAILKFSDFFIGEPLLVWNGTTLKFEEKDIKVSDSRKEYIKIQGTDFLEVGNLIKGKNSGSLAIISFINENVAKFEVGPFLKKEYGWSTEEGKLNNDFQVLPDNDYYQNLSYTVKSPITFQNLETPVNSLLHPVGLKNFADTEILSNATVSIGSSTVISTNVLDILNQERVDAIYNFDYSRDIDDLESSKSKFIELKNKKLSSYIECATNRALTIDDISSRFSNKDNANKNYVDVVVLRTRDDYSRLLIQIIDPNTFDHQVAELFIFKDRNNVFTFQKQYLTNISESLGEFESIIDSSGSAILRFYPYDYLKGDYDIKVFRSQFNTNAAGIGTRSLNNINLVGVNTYVGINSSLPIISVGINSLSSLIANIQVINATTLEKNFIELYLTHDENDVYRSEYYMDTDENSGTYSGSNSSIGTITTNINSGILSLNYKTSNSAAIIKSEIIGFASTTLGSSSYTFTSRNQSSNSAKTVKLVSNYTTSSGVSTVLSFDRNTFTTLKSYIKVGIGSTSALHQILLLNDNLKLVTTQYPYLTVKNTSGLGTFGGVFDGSDVILNFYPDNQYNSSLISLQSYNELLYTAYDFANFPLSLSFGTITQAMSLVQYDGLDGIRINRKVFNATYNGNPIFMKTFDPLDEEVLNLETGVFTIKDHFFSNVEKLIYTPKSSFIGVGETSVGIGATLDSVGVVTTILPKHVYVIKLNNDSFKIATRKDYAELGIGVTFTSVGEGNAHQLEMFKKLEKTLVAIDGVIQHPLSYTPISHTLINNFGGIGAGNTYFALSGITSVFPNDVLKIDNEYMSINAVGLGTTCGGPIVGIGTLFLVNVDRGILGSKNLSHDDSSTARIYSGSYEIVGNTLHFVSAPRGTSVATKNESNLSEARSTFSGRVFLKKDYSNNYIFDDISRSFDGFKEDYKLTVQGINTTGVETGSSILLINDVFQNPSTPNNANNNYTYSEVSGITSVIFSGITSSNGSIIKSLSDVNQNQLPRGGLIVSLASTDGIGYAPLVGASVTAIVGAGGTIKSVGITTLDSHGSGYRGNVSVAITEVGHTGTSASIMAFVGVGGTLSFNVVDGGSGYTNPTIVVRAPNYQNLPIVGVSRRGIGQTTECGKGLLLNVDVKSIADNSVGIGTSFFEVTDYQIARPGYAFQIGDVFKPIGLVTDARLAQPIKEFTLTVIDIFNDNFASWQFGQLEYIDSIQDLQNGSRVRFPLYYNGDLLSFEKNDSDPDSERIDLNSILLILINGVVQVPNESYIFEGGTSFIFTTPPRKEDKVSIFFYRGTRGDDSFLVPAVSNTIKDGDNVKISKNNYFLEIPEQSTRIVQKIVTSDKIETEVYMNQGINDVVYRPLTWIKQKSDKLIFGELVSKARDSIEPLVYPSAKIIKDFTQDDTQLFVDDAQFFNYEENESSLTISNLGALIIENKDSFAGKVTSVVSYGGTIESLIIENGGSGYIGTSVTANISAPPRFGVGIGTIAKALVSISNGELSYPITILNEGYGYDPLNLPNVIVPSPSFKSEKIKNILTVEGFTGIITGITTSSGTMGNSLAIKFFLRTNALDFLSLSTGYPIFVNDTSVGYGITTIDDSDSSVIGIGTLFLDNIYYVHSISYVGNNAVIVSNVKSNSNIIGLNTTGSINKPLGKFSWGRMSGFSRSENPIAIGISGFTINTGLSSFPNIQRRDYGLRSSGALRKSLPS